MKLSATVTAPLYSTEDEEKVAKALLNIFPKATLVQTSDGKIVARISGLEGFEKLRMIIRTRRIRKTVRALLNKGLRDNTVTFYLNKQAASVGKVSFFEEGEVMALGPITVVVETDEPARFIEWLTE
ncbi:MAG: RNA-binding domain-containing protein [Candidatus Caldarchaeum sp.]